MKKNSYLINNIHKKLVYSNIISHKININDDNDYCTFEHSVIITTKMSVTHFTFTKVYDTFVYLNQFHTTNRLAIL